MREVDAQQAQVAKVSPSMRRICVVLIACAGISWITFGGSKDTVRAAAPSTNPSASNTPAPVTSLAVSSTPDFKQHVRPLLQRYCFECHGDGSTSGDLDLDSFQSTADVTRATETWQKVVRLARSRVMPPPDAERQPTQDEREHLVAALQGQLFDPSHPDPGRVSPRRLNRTEYRNTIRDLTGVVFDPSIDFPQDDTGYGFDNIADVLTLPPLLMERYLAAADKIMDEAIPTTAAQSRVQRVAATDARASFKPEDRKTVEVPQGWIALSSRDEDSLSFRVDVPTVAEFKLRVVAYAEPARDAKTSATRPTTSPSRPMVLSLMLGDAVVSEVEVKQDAAHPQTYEARFGVVPGRQSFRVAVRRRRGPIEDQVIRNGRIGEEQDGRILVKQLQIEGPLPNALQRFSGERLELAEHASRGDADAIVLAEANDGAVATLNLFSDGDYLVRVQALAENAGAEPAKMGVRVDDRPQKIFSVLAPAEYKPSASDPEINERARRAAPKVYETPMRLKAGKHRISAAFLNDAYFPDEPRPNFRDRNLIVSWIEVAAVSSDPQSLPVAPKLVPLFAKYAGTSADGRPAARGLLSDFALRAWRRAPRSEELDRLMRLYDLGRSDGGGFRGGVKHAIKAILVSPSFLFREVAPQQQPTTAPVGPYAVDEYELASRLSYFLWSSTPDDELLDLARRNALRTNLDDQIKRMLASPKSAALVDNFVGQWLQFRNLDAADPDRTKFTAYDDRLRDDMKRETQLFFQSIVKEDRSLLDVLTADYTYLNARLAKYYDIKGVDGEGFRRVSLASTSRRGVVTQGSVLTLTSNPTRTSPVKRGKWVLENLLGDAPPPPPANIPPLEGGAGKQLTGTLRQRLEKHRAAAECASCHAPMDPIGFSLENFNAVGQWREKDGGAKVDAASSFPDGTKLNGPVELATLLAKTRKNDFYRSVAEAALTFALGRGIEPFDQPAVDNIVGDLRKNDGRFSSLVSGVVHSVPFQMRRGESQVESTRASAAR